MSNAVGQKESVLGQKFDEFKEWVSDRADELRLLVAMTGFGIANNNVQDGQEKRDPYYPGTLYDRSQEE